MKREVYRIINEISSADGDFFFHIYIFTIQQQRWQLYETTYLLKQLLQLYAKSLS